MDYRINALLIDHAETGTYVDPINLKALDPISRIEVNAQPLSVTPVFVGTPAATIAKLEVVDGSDVLFSLDGEEAQAVNFYNRKESPYNYNAIGDALDSTIGMSIDFGRYLWDESLAFVPNHFSNPQLKITLDLDAFDTSLVTETLTVNAMMFDEKIVSPGGFLMSKEIYQYIPPQSGYKYVKMPTDYPIRQIFYGSKYPDYRISDQIDALKLSTDGDKHVVYNQNIYDYLNLVHATYGRVEESILLKALGAATLEDFYGIQTNNGRAYGFYQDNIDEMERVIAGAGGHYTAYQTLGTGSAEFVGTGYDPHGFIPILWHDQMDPARWLDARLLEEIILRLDEDSGASTDAISKTVVQQLRSY